MTKCALMDKDVQHCTLARHMGMHVKYDITPQRSQRWDGSFAYWGEEVSVTQRIQDIAHWAISPCNRRRHPGFGLDEFEGAEREKVLASALGIAIERLFGMQWIPTAYGHGWTISMGGDLDEIWRCYGMQTYFATQIHTEEPVAQARRLCAKVRNKYLKLGITPPLRS